MNKLDEQQQRHAATMAFFQSGKELAEEIAKEIRRIDAEERRELEQSSQARRVKPVEKEELPPS